jgi:hypothetical protein
MSEESRVVSLLYRADWTRLCLRANAARRFLRRFDIGQPPE